jgi:hypothetical protein
VITRFLDAVIANAGMRRWLAEEGELAMRLLTRHDTGFQPRPIDAVHDTCCARRRTRAGSTSRPTCARSRTCSSA